jgi:lipoyl(octanoyl) transferase
VDSAAEAGARLPSLIVWVDDERRSGAESMAVDQWLFENAGTEPWLRLYRWPPDSASFGYAARLAQVRAALGAPQPVEWVRRWTGGGIVRHGDDLTYTLVLPFADLLAVPAPWRRSAGVYTLVHGALARLLAGDGVATRLAETGLGLPGGACFRQPARDDLLAGSRKIAGAGQRRSARGILHQGSLRDEAAHPAQALALGNLLAAATRPPHPAELPAASAIARLANTRYANPQWTGLR